MPLPMVHFKVARSVYAKLQTVDLDLPRYYIGVLAPDAARNRKGYNYLVDRKQAHFEEDDTMHRLKKINEFLAAKLKDENYSFFLGYAIHIMTDIYRQDIIFKKFRKLYEQTSKMSFNNEREAYAAEMSYIDMQLYVNENMKNEVWSHLHSAICIDFLPYVSADEIETEKAITLSWYDNKDNCPTQYPSLIQYRDVIDFTDRSAALILDRLQHA